ncbi:traf-type zinc finger protein [Diplodia corticola]|uniref:Traf-type zinc finger protein n=1 Tax=Diplodia corticola TaxID=236234 RepID=A0A1J9RB12_9PEZI|nr:traf-type zinc finger protein [Diplodia corticola]OJD37665.1 traf-type zinc finger protein [Diplodia corticola]
MADDSRRSSASSRADTPLLQASTALTPDADITARNLNTMDRQPELIIGGPPSAPSPLELRAFASQPQKSRFAKPVEFHQLELVSPCDKNLCCLICMEPFVDPKRLLCEHTFCDACLSNHIRYAVGQSFSYPGSGARCPTCRRELNMDTEPRAVSRIITNMLDELLVKCPNKAEGCDWQGQRCEAQDHVDFACEYRLVECPARACSHPVMAKDLDKECLHSYVNCEYCEETVMVIALEAHHLKACPFRMDECRDCSSEVVRKEMEVHRSNICPKAIINCPALDFGCDHNCQRDQMDEHKRGCTIAKMLPVLQRMKTREEDLEAENSQLRRQVSCLEQGLNALQAMVALPPGATAYEVPGANDLNLNNLADANNQDMIAQHESLRNEISRLSNMIAEVEARTNIQLHNEVLRINTDMARTDAALGAMRSQQQWLINARLHALTQMRANAAANATGGSTSNTTAGAAAGSTATAGASSRGTLSPLVPTNAPAASSSSTRPGDYQYRYGARYDSRHGGSTGGGHLSPGPSARRENSDGHFSAACYQSDGARFSRLTELQRQHQ